MKNQIIKWLFAIAALSVAVSCNKNDYNEEYLPGFEEVVPGAVKKVSVTLTAPDYTAISKNKANIKIAGDAGADALKAIGTHQFFTGSDSRIYLPEFLLANYYYLDNGSAVKVSFSNPAKGSAELELALKNEYTLVDADYNTVWGNTQTTPFFTPAKPADQYLPAILKSKISGVAKGDMAVVTYSYCKEEPKPETPAVLAAATMFNTRAVTIKNIADIDFKAKEVATAQATVIGTYMRGVLLKDNTGTALYYANKDAGFALGDVIQVTGATEEYNGVKQFGKTATAQYIERATTVEYPATATPITKDNIPTAFTDFNYVSLTGTLAVSGNYYNLKIDGTSVQGSISYPYAALDLKALDGQMVTVTGYLVGVSAKYLNIMGTAARLAMGGTDYTAVGIAATKAGTYTCKGQVVGCYDKGFMLSDGTGYMLVFQGKTSTVAEGKIVTVSGETEIRYSMAQFKSTAVISEVGTANLVRPAAIALTGADIEAYMTAPAYKYASFTGKLTKSDKYYEIHNIEGTEKYGSFSYPLADQKAELDKLNNKVVSVTGYLVGNNTKMGYFSVLYGTVESTVKYDIEERSVAYTFDGSVWKAAETKKIMVINPADYRTMGLSDNFFTKSIPANNYLPAYLSQNYPYAQAKQVVTLIFNYNDGKATTMAGAAYRFDGTAWSQVLVTEQYIKKEGKWTFAPNVEIYLSTQKSDATSVSYYKAIVDYVVKQHGNIYNQLKSDGVETYDNAEYYYGATFYYPEIDFTLLKWRTNSKQGKVEYDTMTDEALRALQLKRLPEAFIPALEANNADAKISSEYDTFYLITFGLYDDAADPKMVYKTITYKLIGDAKWEYVSIEDAQ